MFHVFHVHCFLLCRYLRVQYVAHGVHECSILGPNAMLKQQRRARPLSSNTWYLTFVNGWDWYAMWFQYVIPWLPVVLNISLHILTDIFFFLLIDPIHFILGYLVHVTCSFSRSVKIFSLPLILKFTKT